jgi:L-lactate dehydrogenase (cytochrome)
MLSQHCYTNDAWIALNDKVYDMTDYGTKHPGGKIIFDFAGKDGT